MTRRLYLVTFATPDFAASRDRLIASALSSGQFTDAFAWDDERLRCDRSFGARPLLDHSRGIGYWSWKPHIILEAFRRVQSGDVVVYSDAGRYDGGYTIRRSVSPLVEFAERHDGLMPGVLIPNFGPNALWTRRDCFVLMGCDTPYYWQHPQVQATFSIWIKSQPALDFLNEWRDYCADIRIVGDGPNISGFQNLPGFIDHRHDQSVLTNLVLKHGASPFVIESLPFNWLVALRPKSLSANLVFKKIDNVSAIASGANPVILFARELWITKMRRPLRVSQAVGTVWRPERQHDHE